MIAQSLTHTSLVARLGLLVSISPMVMGVVYAVRPSERRLALMRPLSLAGIFAALCNLLVGLANALRSIGDQFSGHVERPSWGARAVRRAHPDVHRFRMPDRGLALRRPRPHTTFIAVM
jgi:hypothetical protein